jgi:hypothetical protein
VPIKTHSKLLHSVNMTAWSLCAPLTLPVAPLFTGAC